MVAYTDLPAANALYDEQERINQGITLVDAGGLLASFTILPPSPDPENPSSAMMMSVLLQAINPTPALMQAVRDAMVARSADITTELLALGVTDPPPDPDPPTRRT